MNKAVIIKKDGKIETHPLDHLFGLDIEIKEFQYESGIVGNVRLVIKPTNHLYSREKLDSDNVAQLKATGELITRYDHYPNDPDSIKLDANGNSKISSELRVFCEKKYEQSFILNIFLQRLTENFHSICVLPHSEDPTKILTTFAELPEKYTTKYGEGVYIVIFKLHKKLADRINMVVETAFIAPTTDWRSKLFQKNSGKLKPLIVLMKNIFSGRNPFEGKALKQAKKAYKKKKKERLARDYEA